jgi:hypothetical protein
MLYILNLKTRPLVYGPIYVPKGHFDSSPVRSAGKLCKKICPSRGNDRTPGAWFAHRFASTSNHRSSLRDGRVFVTISRHFVPGYYQMSLRDINGPSQSASEVLRALGLNMYNLSKYGFLVLWTRPLTFGPKQTATRSETLAAAFLELLATATGARIVAADLCGRRQSR